jgi:lysophospholipase L1-like esterase
LKLAPASCEASCAMKRMAVVAAGVALVLSGAALTLDATAQARTTARSSFTKPQQYYLALGDSIAYGIQPDKAEAGLPPSKFNTGYVDVFAARLRALAPKIKVVNYACPGESAKTFIRGGCSGRGDVKGLHDDYKGTQLAAALAFLHARPGRVGPITITLWGNDLFEDFAPTCKTPQCVVSHSAAGLARLGSRLSTIVGRLRAAAPKAEIILTGAWNFDVEHRAVVDPLFHSIDAVIARAASAHGARVAKMYRVFAATGKNPKVCALTFICSRDDVHPNDAGYRAMADVFLAASGYARS